MQHRATTGCIRTPYMRGVCRGRPRASSSFSSDFAVESLFSHAPPKQQPQAIGGGKRLHCRAHVAKSLRSCFELNCIQLQTACSRIKRWAESATVPSLHHRCSVSFHASMLRPLAARLPLRTSGCMFVAATRCEGMMGAAFHFGAITRRFVGSSNHDARRMSSHSGLDLLLVPPPIAPALLLAALRLNFDAGAQNHKVPAAASAAVSRGRSTCSRSSMAGIFAEEGS